MKKDYLLFVDDEGMVLEILSKILSVKIPETPVYSAGDGSKAITLMEELELQGWYPSVVISDLMMPEMTGDALLTWVHGRYPHAKTILLTGRAQVESLTKAINQGGLYRFIQKPWDTADILMTIQEALKSYRQERLLEELQLIKRLSHLLNSCRNFSQVKETVAGELEKFFEGLTLELGLVSPRGARLEIVGGSEAPWRRISLSECPCLHRVVQLPDPHLDIPAEEVPWMGSGFISAVPFTMGEGKLGVLLMGLPRIPRDIYLRTFLETLGGLLSGTAEMILSFEKEKAARRAAEEAHSTKSRFFANMSHEIRTPMNAILGFTQVLLGADDLTADQRENLEIIRSSGEHLLGLINEVLDYSKIEAGRLVIKKTPFLLSDVAAKVHNLFDLQAQQKGLIFRCLLDQSLKVKFLGDEAKVSQILINLVGNSFKFTKSGEILVEILPGDRGDMVHFTVSDTGEGIDTEDQARIFEPFVTGEHGDSSAFGTGLGLAISRKLAESMGGHMTLQSVRGEGTTIGFTLKLPRIPEDSDLPCSTAASGDPRVGDLLTPLALKALPALWRKNTLRSLSDGGLSPEPLLAELEPQWEPFRRALGACLEEEGRHRLRHLLEASL